MKSPLCIYPSHLSEPFNLVIFNISIYSFIWINTNKNKKMIKGIRTIKYFNRIQGDNL